MKPPSPKRNPGAQVIRQGYLYRQVVGLWSHVEHIQYFYVLQNEHLFFYTMRLKFIKPIVGFVNYIFMHCILIALSIVRNFLLTLCT